MPDECVRWRISGHNVIPLDVSATLSVQFDVHCFGRSGVLTDSGTRRWTDALVELQRKQDAIIRDTDWRAKPLTAPRWQLNCCTWHRAAR